MGAHIEGILVPLIIFGCVAVIAIVPQLRRSRERVAAIEAIRSLAEKGQPTPPELAALLRHHDRPLPALAYLMAGLINLAMAAGFLALAYSQYHFSRLAQPYVNGGIVGAAAFPGFIGLVLLGFWLLNRRRLED